VNEVGMIRTQMETHNKSVMVAVLGTLCAIPYRNRNSTYCNLFTIENWLYN
jgi:hypothetical protein